jgi:hypothetical protein
MQKLSGLDQPLDELACQKTQQLRELPVVGPLLILEGGSGHTLSLLVVLLTQSSQAAAQVRTKLGGQAQTPSMVRASAKTDEN